MILCSACAALDGLPWVREVTVRLPEEGHVVAGEVYIVPVEENIGVAQLQEAVDRA